MRKLFIFGLILIISGLLLTGCSPANNLVEENPFRFTKTPTQTVTSTKTVLWFPPTNTPTPFFTRTMIPTANRKPGVGELFLVDIFSSQGSWSITQKEYGSTAIANQELSIVLSESGKSLASIRSEPVLDDYYLEITASPSLCRQNDTYGVLLRAEEENLYYRFALNCNGMMRLDRVKNGYYSILQDWIPSGQVPVGSPVSLKLGVWAYKDELRFFINDYYQFSMNNLIWLSGQIGVFARSESETTLSVSFSDLNVFELTEEASNNSTVTLLNQTPFPTLTINPYDRTITPVSTAAPFPTLVFPTAQSCGFGCGQH